MSIPGMSSLRISFSSSYSFLLISLSLYLSDLEFHKLSRLWRASTSVSVAGSLQSILFAAIRLNKDWREKRTLARFGGLGFSETCQIYLLAQLHEQFSHMTIFYMTSMLAEKLACQFLNKCTCHMKNCHMAPSTRANKTCHRNNCHRKLVVELRL